MIQLTPEQMNRLKANYNEGRRSYYLVKMQIAGTWYYITDADSEIEYQGATYYPGYFSDGDLDDIETTSEPKVNDVTLKIGTYENSFKALFLGHGWMNGLVVIYEHHRDWQGEIFTKNIYQGLISDFGIDEPKETMEINISSIWADFEKTAGIKTNAKSQQRFYPNDTAFEHASLATNKIFWGRKSPDANAAPTGSALPQPENLNQN